MLVAACHLLLVAVILRQHSGVLGAYRALFVSSLLRHCLSLSLCLLQSEQEVHGLDVGCDSSGCTCTMDLRELREVLRRDWDLPFQPTN